MSMTGYYVVFEVIKGPDGLEVQKRLPGEYSTEKKAQDFIRGLGGDPRGFAIVWVME